MPAILALDTSTDVCSVALLIDNQIVEKVSLAAREHTKHILNMTEEVLASAELALAQLDAVAFSCGPGSFTGLRICLSVAQGLAYGQSLPLISVSTLLALAAKAHRTIEIESESDIGSSVLIPVIDARMNEVYTCVYRPNLSELSPLMDEQVLEPQQLVPLLSQADIEQFSLIGIGSGWRYPELNAIDCVIKDLGVHPSAHDVAQLALSAYQRGELIDPLQAEPRYLRNEISWQKRQRIR